MNVRPLYCGLYGDNNGRTRDQVPSAPTMRSNGPSLWPSITTFQLPSPAGNTSCTTLSQRTQLGDSASSRSTQRDTIDFRARAGASFLVFEMHVAAPVQEPVALVLVTRHLEEHLGEAGPVQREQPRLLMQIERTTL